jgi:LacI family transcriptional regulator
MSSIREIASKAGVSLATVSHVINKTRYVSPELTFKVESIMEELDYQPNMMAGSLRSKKTKTIGLIIPDSSNLIFSQIGQVIETECALADHNVIFCNSSYDVETELRNVDTLRMKMVDGIIILPSSDKEDCIDKLLKIKIPFVVVNSHIKNPDLDIIYVDNELLGIIATEYLLELGHRSIFYIDRMLDHHYSIARWEGFNKALKKHGLEYNEDMYCRSGGIGFADGFRAMDEALKSGIKMDAVFSYNDTHAIGAIRALQEHGLRVPEDVSVIGCDNIPVSEFIKPSLTTMKYPVHELGAESARILLEKLKNPDIETSNVVLHPELIKRQSTSQKYQTN